MEEVIEVAVVGGGPTGLLLACELALAGVRVRVFERRSAPVRESRALTMHPRSLEVLALRGLEERFLSRGRPLPGGHFALLDTRLDFSVLDTRFQFTLFLPQALTESLLEERARELGVDLRRGHAVEAMRQDAEAVELTGTTGGQPFRCRARYVVGADGARSAVRQLAGIAFPGTDGTRTSMLGDVTLGTPPAAPFLAITNERGNVAIVPLGPGVHRAIVTDAEREGTPLKEPVTLDELRASLQRIAGSDFGIREPRWLSRFGNETRLAETYRAGRVLLAGDAAHMHYPAGGQGLNVGLQDAMNLGWKLAAVVRDGAPDWLMDSYHRERHGVGHALLRNTQAQSALMGFTPETLALRELMCGVLKNPEVNRRLAEHLGGLDVAYPALELPAPEGAAPLLPDWTGRRLPDLDLRLSAGDNRRLYTALHPGHWLWLHSTEATRPAPRWEPGWAPRASVLHVSPTGGSERLRGVGGLLVRPDGHVAWAWAA
ncbi:FAD-dependent monooxygenase [Pyxidicoccus xibeiensis]|uniref:FAD-dependent monooxygenase n=1 Tax=Pyxidicoccus xibeiensis TaxID=2906759 RepID=UPI0020A7BAA0|nr:FAD-dependent monooxygenase [Pyxidicoccus xibeiensis]MCP3137564.1 FAD-dependent monooxygenase [Pyxidicoccus xibeiensis]